MSRAIDADALEPDADYYEGDYWAVSIVQIHNAPTIEPEQKKGTWIPVTERLPEEGQEILATTTDNAWGDVVIIRTYYKEMHKSVIAWMPLPEPYREGAQE